MTGLLSILLVAATPPTEVTATLLDGQPVRGELIDWDGPTAKFRVRGETVELPAERLLVLRWDARGKPPARPETYVELVDGSRLPLSMTGDLSTAEATAQFLVTDRVAKFIPAGATRVVAIPTQLLRVVQLLPEAAAADSLWREVHEQQLAGDVLVVRKRKDQSLDYLTGVVGDLTDSQLIFQWEGETIPVKRSKVAAVAYYHPKRHPNGHPNGHPKRHPKRHPKEHAQGQTPEEADESATPSPICRLVTSRGAVLVVARLSLQEDRLKVKTVSGIALELPVEELVSADFSFGKLVYLSDLKPLSVRWTPRIGLPAKATTIRRYGEPRDDVPFGPPDSGLADTGQVGAGMAMKSSPLMLRWQSATDADREGLRTYAKGLAIRSRTELVYQLPKAMRHFRAIAGIDPSTSMQGNVDLKLSGDRGGLWQGAIDGKHQPVEIDLDLQGSSRLTILVDYGENLDWGDRLHLVDARVTR